MFLPKADVFLLIADDENRRDLIAGQVVDFADQNVTIRLHEAITLQPGAAVLLHCEVNHKFMQQGGSVTAYLEGGEAPLFAVAVQGQPISAENRTMLRVSLAASDLKCKVDKDADAVLLDVSPAGFAVSSTLKLTLATVVNATLTFEGKPFSGQARVQSIRELSPTKTRYGLHAVETGRGLNPLQRGLGQMTAAVQRQQLRRRAGA